METTLPATNNPFVDKLKNPFAQPVFVIRKLYSKEWLVAIYEYDVLFSKNPKDATRYWSTEGLLIADAAKLSRKGYEIAIFCRPGTIVI